MKKRRWADDEPGRKRPIDEPAGVKRREAMAQAKDELEEEAEVRAEALGVEAIDPAKFRIDHEIAGDVINSNRVENADHANYVYAWVRDQSANGLSNQVDEKLRWTCGGLPVWEVVSGDMKEAWNRRDAAGYRRLKPDCILMRAKREQHEKLEAFLEEVHRKRMGAADRDLKDAADKHGINVHLLRGESTENLPESIQRAQAHAASAHASNVQEDIVVATAIVKRMEREGHQDAGRARQSLTQMVKYNAASQRLEQMIRQGKVPGMEINR